MEQNNELTPEMREQIISVTEKLNDLIRNVEQGAINMTASDVQAATTEMVTAMLDGPRELVARTLGRLFAELICTNVAWQHENAEKAGGLRQADLLMSVVAGPLIRLVAANHETIGLTANQRTLVEVGQFITDLHDVCTAGKYEQADRDLYVQSMLEVRESMGDMTMEEFAQALENEYRGVA